MIGLGTIGSGIVRSLDRSGVTPLGYDIHPDRARDLPCRGVGSPAEVTQSSDVVLVSVVNAAQAREVLFGADGVAAARRDVVVGLVSTVSLEDLTALATDAESAGIRLLDTPVTGGQHAAVNGLIVMVGGRDDDAAAAMPALRAFSKFAIHCGPLGAGMAAKLVRQVVVYGSWKVMYDAARFAEATGVDYADVKRINQEADAHGDTVIGLMWMRGDSLAPLGEAKQQELRRYYDLMVKDVHAALDLGESAGIRLPLLEELVGETGPAMFGVTIGSENDG